MAVSAAAGMLGESRTAGDDTEGVSGVAVMTGEGGRASPVAGGVMVGGSASWTVCSATGAVERDGGVPRCVGARGRVC